MDAFRVWVANNYKFPREAVDAGVKGTVLVCFIVEKDGSLSDIKIKKDLGYGTGEEALRLMERAKKWKPGFQNGQPVRVEFTYPIRLDLSL